MLKLLGEHKDVYYVPVNPNVLPDYYQVCEAGGREGEGGHWRGPVNPNVLPDYYHV